MLKMLEDTTELCRFVVNNNIEFIDYGIDGIKITNLETSVTYTDPDYIVNNLHSVEKFLVLIKSIVDLKEKLDNNEDIGQEMISKLLVFDKLFFSYDLLLSARDVLEDYNSVVDIYSKNKITKG